MRLRGVLLGTVVAACTGSPAPSPGPSPGPTPQHAQEHSQDKSMIHFVRDLAQFVSHTPQTVDALTARLGKLLPEGDDPAVLVAPSDPRLRQIRIERRPDGTPLSIGLALAQPLPVAELKAAFGAYKTAARSDPD